MTNCFVVFGMSAEEVGEIITDLLGKKMRLEILEILDKELGKAKIAKAANILVPTLAKIFERQSLGDKLSKKIFTGVAREYPEVLKVAIESVFEKYKYRLEKTLFGEILEELINRKKEKVKKAIS